MLWVSSKGESIHFYLNNTFMFPAFYHIWYTCLCQKQHQCKHSIPLSVTCKTLSRAALLMVCQSPGTVSSPRTALLAVGHPTRSRNWGGTRENVPQQDYHRPSPTRREKCKDKLQPARNSTVAVPTTGEEQHEASNHSSPPKMGLCKWGRNKFPHAEAGFALASSVDLLWKSNGIFQLCLGGPAVEVRNANILIFNAFPSMLTI